MQIDLQLEQIAAKNEQLNELKTFVASLELTVQNKAEFKSYDRAKQLSSPATVKMLGISMNMNMIRLCSRSTV